MNKNIEMLEINKKQKVYYETADGSNESDVNNSITNIYRRFKTRIYGVLTDAGIKRATEDLHKRWIHQYTDELKTKKILDLGAGEGSNISLFLAKNAGTYVATDLSESRLEILKKKLNENDAKNPILIPGDFLEPDFPEGDFDIVYANSVLHHFKHLDPFLKILSSRMKKGAIVLTHDPLKTWIPMSIFRMMYKKVATDSLWEYPFGYDSIQIINSHFNIEQLQGILGRSKWCIPLSIVNKKLAIRKAHKWHQYDMHNANSIEHIKKCLQVCMLLQIPKST